MKKYCILLFALCVPFFFSACDPPDKVRKGDITGTWKFSKVSVASKGGPAGLSQFLNEIADNLINDIDHDTELTFKFDKTGAFVSNRENYTFTYSLSGTKLTMITDESQKESVVTVNSITKSQMVWSRNITDEVNEKLTKSFPGMILFDQVIGYTHFAR